MTETALSTYTTSIEEVFWGALLIALTMAIHGLGVVATLRAGGALQRRHAVASPLRNAMRILIASTWILVLVHLLEVLVWATFFWLNDAFGNLSTAFYYSLMQYTTVSSQFRPPEQLRLLGGMIAMAGLLTFAWSTSVLLILGRRFQDSALQHGDN